MLEIKSQHLFEVGLSACFLQAKRLKICYIFRGAFSPYLYVPISFLLTLFISKTSP